MKTQTVTIFGLERIGGSIGLALRASNLGLTVVGVENDRAIVEMAKEMGAIDKSARNLPSAASESDILILNTPIVEQEATIRAIGQDVRPHALIVDISGLKGPGVKWAEAYLQQGHYIGATPILAAATLSDSRSGIEAAREDLFKHSVFCIMPSPNAEPDAVKTAVNLGHIIGATPFFLDAFEYDSLMHGVDTTPGLLAAAMFRAVTRSPGWRDILRFTGLPFALATAALENEDLTALAFSDKQASLRWLDAILDEMQQVRRWLAEGDEERLELILKDLARERARWMHERQENSWTEQTVPDEIETIGLGSQLFGFRGSRKKKDDPK